jgi:site-specific DNA recombinase
MMKAEIHRILQNPIYTGDFLWHGRLFHGSHEPLISREMFAAVQAVLNRKPRARYPKQRHAFMGLLTCARCGCAMTAERKKGKYTYYRCTAFHDRCGNAYIREERLAQLLGGVVDKMQLPERVAKAITVRLHASQAELEQARGRSSARLLERQRALQAKIDRGYDDYVEGRISDALWARKSAEWETELATVTAELRSLDQPATTLVATGERILELVKRAGILHKTQDPAEQRRVLESLLSNCTFDRGSVRSIYCCPPPRCALPPSLLTELRRTGRA